MLNDEPEGTDAAGDDISDYAKERFKLLFGVELEHLQRQNVDLLAYVKAHIKDATEGLYRSYEERLAASESLLPYLATTPYISRGVTKFARSYMADVSLDADYLRLASGNSLLVEAAPGDVRVRRVMLWMGIGVCLDFGEQGKWYVQPLDSPWSIRRALSATRVFRAALQEAGATLSGWSLFGSPLHNGSGVWFKHQR